MLSKFLQYHPDPSKVDFVLRGFTFGFDIGFRGPVLGTRPQNLRSAYTDIAATTTAINKEIQRKHTSGPFVTAPFSNLHCSPLGAVSKPDGTSRLILDLSSPRGSAINEGIVTETSVSYSHFDDAVDLVRMVGTGAFLAKLDIRHAFRICPVLPTQWPLLGFHWQGFYYVDTRLPFGSRTSPFLFNGFADLLCWILVTVGGIALMVHYLDDYFITAYSSSHCARDMDTMCAICNTLGVPLSPEKMVGPSQKLTYLGIEIDTTTMSVQLSDEKLRRLQLKLAEWQAKRTCKKRELLSLIGSLSFACKVIKPGRIFLRRLIELSTTVSSLNHYVTLTAAARADIVWWQEFLPTWNGRARIQPRPIDYRTLHLYTDASNIGLGAVYGERWICARWPPNMLKFHINIKELFAIWAATITWGVEWRDKQIIISTDSEVITKVWTTGSCKEQDIMHIIRALFKFTARHNINLLMKHIPGSTNVNADLLSRLQVHQFQSRNPFAQPTPSLIPTQVWRIWSS